MSSFYPDATFYINLAHRKDRDAQMQNELKRLALSAQRIEAIYDPLNGHRGCALSHIHALKLAQKKKFQNILILEDDCTFEVTKEKLRKSLESFFQQMKRWDVLLLGGNIAKTEQSPIWGVQRVLSSQCGHAYLVNQHYISSLIECFEECLQLMGQDLFSEQSLPHAIDQRWKKLQAKDLWYIMEIFAQQSDSFSDIEGVFRDRKHRL